MDDRYFHSPLLRSLRSYFVVKSLHFLKESKIFLSLSLSLFPKLRNQKITEKIEKMYPWNWGVSIHYSAMEQFTDLSFEYIKLVCKICPFRIKMKRLQCHYGIYLVISSFNRHFWRFWPYSESGILFLLMDTILIWAWIVTSCMETLRGHSHIDFGFR